jgi:hypothetical protein
VTWITRPEAPCLEKPWGSILNQSNIKEWKWKEKKLNKRIKHPRKNKTPWWFQWHSGITVLGIRKWWPCRPGEATIFLFFYLLYFLFIKISNYPLPNLIIIKNKNTKKSLDISFKSFVFKDNFTILLYLKNIRISNYL